MNPYIDNLIQQLKAYEARCEYRGEVSAVDILWDYYLSINSPDDGTIKAAPMLCTLSTGSYLSTFPMI